jgi:NMD protein affecting ribosome stability and mRNA decay
MNWQHLRPGEDSYVTNDGSATNLYLKEERPMTQALTFAQCMNAKPGDLVSLQDGTFKVVSIIGDSIVLEEMAVTTTVDCSSMVCPRCGQSCGLAYLSGLPLLSDNPEVKPREPTTWNLPCRACGFTTVIRDKL